MTDQNAITIKFKKRKSPQEKDTVTIQHGDENCIFRARQQDILPHEMVQYAVEKLFPLRGFIRLVAAGYPPEELMDMTSAGTEALQAEALTNAYQYELWDVLPASNENFRLHISNGWESPDVHLPEITDDQIEQGRILLQVLMHEWHALAFDEEIVYSLPT